MSQILYVFSHVSTFDDVLHPTKLMTENTVSSLLLSGFHRASFPRNPKDPEQENVDDTFIDSPSFSKKMRRILSNITLLSFGSSRNDNKKMSSMSLLSLGSTTFSAESSDVDNDRRSSARDGVQDEIFLDDSGQFSKSKNREDTITVTDSEDSGICIVMDGEAGE
jgi:hypothetical protein